MESLSNFVNIYKTSFTEVKELIEKMDQNKIVSHRIRRAYYDLLKDFYGGLLKYKNNVYSFDIYRNNSEYVVTVDGNKFTIPVKINTYFDNNGIENLPINYYVESNGRYVSTNKFAVSMIDQVLVVLMDINVCLTL